MLQCNKLLYSPLTQVRFLYYQPPRHKPFHLVISFQSARNNKTIPIDTTITSINNRKAFLLLISVVCTFCIAFNKTNQCTIIYIYIYISQQYLFI
jgi:hypothetical protein